MRVTLEQGDGCRSELRDSSAGDVEYRLAEIDSGHRHALGEGAEVQPGPTATSNTCPVAWVQA